MKKPRILWFEPLVFLFFGLLHLHRVWALVDRGGYSAFWLSAMQNRDWFYFTLMGIMAALCVAGIAVFFLDRGRKPWWRWFYLFGGGYVLFDLFAILVRLEIWQKLLLAMFDTAAPYWDLLWGGFVGLGAVSFLIGISLIRRRSP